MSQLHQTAFFQPTIVLATLLAISSANSSILFAQGGFGGGGFSSATFSSIRSSAMPPADSIIIEEMYNYHRHDITLPENNDSIALDVRFGSTKLNRLNREAYLQVGLATKRDVDLTAARPLNIAFVIDRSGSMDGMRIANVKVALKTCMKKMRSIDRVSIVTFSDKSELVAFPQLVSAPDRLNIAIDGIKTGGSTNLSAGLMHGYQMVKRNFKKAHNNRVILLTDGNANEGIVDSEKISKASARYNKLGIELSTIGVGKDFNHALMRKLARNGQGLIHFVADDEDIHKVFVEELDGLLSAVARKIRLSFRVKSPLQIERIFGYSPKVAEDSVEFDLDPLNSGTTQLVLAKLKVRDSLKKDAEIPVVVKLQYEEVASGKTRSLSGAATLRFRQRDGRRINNLSDPVVRRNITIADLALGIRQAAEFSELDKVTEAENLLKDRLQIVRLRYRMFTDPKVARVKKLALKYVNQLRN